MLFLLNSEVQSEFLYYSTFRYIFLEHAFFNDNVENINLPNIDLFFVFKNIEDEIDLLKIANHLVLLWLLGGTKAKLVKLSSRLHRGKKYYRFVLTNSIKTNKFILNFFDFFINTFLYLLDKTDLRVYNNLNEFFFEIMSLEIFSNIRLSRSFYTAKINDRLLLKFYFLKTRKQVLNLDYVLKTFKLF